MPNPFEKPPTPTPEKPPEKPAEGLEEKKIEIVTPIGARKRTPEEIEEYKRIREKIERGKDLIFRGLFKDTDLEGRYLLEITCQAKRENGEKISKVIEESIWIGGVKKR